MAREKERKAPEPKSYQATFEVFDVCSRRLRNGNKLRVVLEAPYDRDEEKRLLDYKYGEALVTMQQTQRELGLVDDESEPGMSDETRGELKKAGVL